MLKPVFNPLFLPFLKRTVNYCCSALQRSTLMFRTSFYFLCTRSDQMLGLSSCDQPSKDDIGWCRKCAACVDARIFVLTDLSHFCHVSVTLIDPHILFFCSHVSVSATLPISFLQTSPSHIPSLCCFQQYRDQQKVSLLC